MPVNNPILRHWQIEIRVFYKNLSLLQQQLNADAIHDLRVSIKKLRSYLKIYIALSGKEDTEGLFSETRKLFSLFGRHRNIEMSRKLLQSFPGTNKQSLNSVLAYLQLLLDQVSEYCREILCHYKNEDLDKLTTLVEQSPTQYNTEETIKTVRGLIASSMENINHNLKHFREKSHLIRKDLKNIFYWVKTFENDPVLTKPLVKLIDKILDHLGNIQDHEVMIKNLKIFRKTILSRGIAEYNQVETIESDAKNKKEILLEKANKLTEELIKGL
ncbi:MAG: CHAD domain-containing protein [Chitinophagales bacterium]